MGIIEEKVGRRDVLGLLGGLAAAFATPASARERVSDSQWIRGATGRLYYIDEGGTLEENVDDLSKRKIVAYFTDDEWTQAGGRKAIPNRPVAFEISWNNNLTKQGQNGFASAEAELFYTFTLLDMVSGLTGQRIANEYNYERDNILIQLGKDVKGALFDRSRAPLKARSPIVARGISMLLDYGIGALDRANSLNIHAERMNTNNSLAAVRRFLEHFINLVGTESKTAAVVARIDAKKAAHCETLAAEGVPRVKYRADGETLTGWGRAGCPIP